MSKSKKDQPYSSHLKGVSALLGNDIPEATGNTIPLKQIKLPPQQPRRYFDSKKLEELSNSIKKLGVLEPLLVRQTGTDTYELIAGERRLRASQMVGLFEVPVIICSFDDDTTAEVRLIENLQREDLNPVEETEGILELLVIQIGIKKQEVISHLHRMRNVCDRDSELRDNVMSQSESLVINELFESLGRMTWASFVKNRLPLLKLPSDVLEFLRAGKIEYTKARVIAKIKDTERRVQVLNRAVSEQLSLSQIKVMIRSSDNEEKQPPSLKERHKQVASRLQKSSVWDNPRKKKRVEKLLKEIETILLDEEDS